MTNGRTLSTPPDGELDGLALAARHGSAPPPEVQGPIGNLLQAYALLTDAGRESQMAALFTADATWDGRELGYGTASGPEAIAAMVLTHFRPDAPMVHLPGPPLLVQTGPEQVDAYTWCLATRLSEGRMSPLIYFAYEDTLVRDAGAWRFRRRTLRLRLGGPPPGGGGS